MQSSSFVREAPSNEENSFIASRSLSPSRGEPTVAFSAVEMFSRGQKRSVSSLAEGAPPETHEGKTHARRPPRQKKELQSSTSSAALRLSRLPLFGRRHRSKESSTISHRSGSALSDEKDKSKRKSGRSMQCGGRDYSPLGREVSTNASSLQTSDSRIPSAQRCSFSGQLYSPQTGPDGLPCPVLYQVSEMASIAASHRASVSANVAVDTSSRYPSSNAYNTASSSSTTARNHASATTDDASKAVPNLTTSSSSRMPSPSHTAMPEAFRRADHAQHIRQNDAGSPVTESAPQFASNASVAESLVDATALSGLCDVFPAPSTRGHGRSRATMRRSSSSHTTNSMESGTSGTNAHRETGLLSSRSGASGDGRGDNPSTARKLRGAKAVLRRHAGGGRGASSAPPSSSVAASMNDSHGPGGLGRLTTTEGSDNNYSGYPEHSDGSGDQVGSRTGYPYSGRASNHHDFPRRDSDAIGSLNSGTTSQGTDSSRTSGSRDGREVLPARSMPRETSHPTAMYPSQPQRRVSFGASTNSTQMPLVEMVSTSSGSFQNATRQHSHVLPSSPIGSGPHAGGATTVPSAPAVNSPGLLPTINTPVPQGAHGRRPSGENPIRAVRITDSDVRHSGRGAGASKGLTIATTTSAATGSDGLTPAGEGGSPGRPAMSSARSSDTASSGDEAYAAEHEKKVDAVLMRLTLDHKPTSTALSVDESATNGGYGDAVVTGSWAGIGNLGWPSLASGGAAEGGGGAYEGLAMFGGAGSPGDTPNGLSVGDGANDAGAGTAASGNAWTAVGGGAMNSKDWYARMRQRALNDDDDAASDNANETAGGTGERADDAGASDTVNALSPTKKERMGSSDDIVRADSKDTSQPPGALPTETSAGSPSVPTLLPQRVAPLPLSGTDHASHCTAAADAARVPSPPAPSDAADAQPVMLKPTPPKQPRRIAVPGAASKSAGTSSSTRRRVTDERTTAREPGQKETPAPFQPIEQTAASRLPRHSAGSHNSNLTATYPAPTTASRSSNGSPSNDSDPGEIKGGAVGTTAVVAAVRSSSRPQGHMHADWATDGGTLPALTPESSEGSARSAKAFHSFTSPVLPTNPPRQPAAAVGRKTSAALALPSTTGRRGSLPLHAPDVELVLPEVRSIGADLYGASAPRGRPHLPPHLTTFGATTPIAQQQQQQQLSGTTSKAGPDHSFRLSPQSTLSPGSTKNTPLQGTTAGSPSVRRGSLGSPQTRQVAQMQGADGISHSFSGSTDPGQSSPRTGSRSIAGIPGAPAFAPQARRESLSDMAPASVGSGSPHNSASGSTGARNGLHFTARRRASLPRGLSPSALGSSSGSSSNVAWGELQHLSNSHSAAELPSPTLQLSGRVAGSPAAGSTAGRSDVTRRASVADSASPKEKRSASTVGGLDTSRSVPVLRSTLPLTEEERSASRNADLPSGGRSSLHSSTPVAVVAPRTIR